MTSKTTNKFSPEVRTRAVRMVLDHASEHPSRWAAVTSIAAKIGCTPQTLHDWVKKAEIDSGQRAGVPNCGFRGLRPGIPIERDHAFRSKAATCSDEGGRGVVAGMRSWVRFSWLRQDWRAAQ